jgi:hypothetical protein
MFDVYQYHFVDVIDHLNNDNMNEIEYDLLRIHKRCNISVLREETGQTKRIKSMG